MTERFLPPQDDTAHADFRTPIDVVRNGEELPSDMMLGYVSKSSTFAEIRILKLVGIGQHGSEHAHNARDIERQIRLDTNFLQQRRTPYVHEARPRFLWVPPAKFEIFEGLIAHPDRPDERTGQPTNVQEWLERAKREAYREGKSYSSQVVDDAPDESETHVFATHGVQRGVSDWPQRDNVTERSIHILPDVVTIPDALTALTDSIQTRAEVPSQNIPNVLQFFVEVHDRYGLQ